MPLVSNAESKKFRNEYNSGMSIPVLAAKYNRSVETVHRWLRTSGSIRSSSEAVALKIRQGYKPHAEPRRTWFFDEAVFERELTPESAWLLGLVFADGSVNHRGRLLLACGSDLDLAQKAAQILKHEKKPKKTRNCWMLEVCSMRLVRSLNLLGVVPAKTFTMRFPTLSETLLPHFVRGAWEGDGTFYIDKTGWLHAKYTSASKHFVTSLGRVLREQLAVRSKVGVGRSSKSKNPSYSVAYGCSTAERLGDWLYSESSEQMRAARKYRIWERA